MKFLKLLYKNILLLALLAPIVLLVCCLGLGGLAYFDIKAKEPPSIEEAPWVIQTYSEDEMRIPSRIYYAAEASIIEGKTVIREYWAFDGRGYKKYAEEKVLPVNSKIIRRQQ